MSNEAIQEKKIQQLNITEQINRQRKKILQNKFFKISDNDSLLYYIHGKVNQVYEKIFQKKTN